VTVDTRTEPAAQAGAAHVFTEGDIAREKSTGMKFTVDDVNENPNYREDEEYFLSGTAQGGMFSVDVLSPDDVELVMSAAAADARAVPTAEQLAPQIASGLTAAIGDVVVDVNGSSIDGPGSISVYGRTGEGLPVGFTITITDIKELDE